MHAGIADSPREQTPPGADPREQTPLRSRDPPGADTPLGADPPAQCMLGDMANKQVVHILLECILVDSILFKTLSPSIPQVCCSVRVLRVMLEFFLNEFH